MTTVFVTGTGTGVGKTYVCAELIAVARARGLRVRALKPVLSGYTPEAARESDAGRLVAALGLDVTPERVAAVAPWRFREPLSPDMAARREGRSLELDALVDACAPPPGGSFDLTLVEGVGGVMVPLDARHTVLDWVARLNGSVLLVAGSYLGTLSHTLTAAAALASRGCAVGAVAVCQSAEQPVPLAETVEALARFLTPLRVLGVKRDATQAGDAVFGVLLDECLESKGRARFATATARPR